MGGGQGLNIGLHHLDLFSRVAGFSAEGITHTFHPSDGAHTWINWRKYLAEVAPQLWPTGSAVSATGR
jgi:enterochelin esterase-like enzyme